MPDYKYFFFSYKRHALTLDWTRQVYRRLQSWLTEEMGRHVEVFVDTDQIEVGVQWPTVLQQALLSFRCMVCIWSPSYFQSGWCVSEWQSFRDREQHIGPCFSWLDRPATVS